MSNTTIDKAKGKIKEAVGKAYETHLQEGIYVERRLLYATFATNDRAEGMNAFAERRPPTFLDR